ncbi:MAG TPA: hypothetical protein VMR74_07155 [Gammaproteobacteria bacterium]|nr:hypothetical protein [Gammaproteobacteria bacterium]
MIKSARAAAVAAAAAVTAGCTASDSGTACDRACLMDLADGYLAALAAHDPAAVPLADDLAFVENVRPMRPGEGLWASAGETMGFRIYVPDPAAGAVGMIVVIDRQGPAGIVPALLAARLEVEDGEITEAEHLVADVPAEADLARLESPRPNLTADVPESERMPRAELAAIAASYYEALNLSDGNLAPFAEDCERQENGMIAAGPGLEPAPFDGVDVDGRAPPPVARDCVGQMSSRRFAYIDSIDNRRVFAVDPARGLVMGLSHFRQSMARGPHLMIAADGSELMWEEQREPYDLPAAHIFRITDGRIHEVEAVGIFLPYGSPTGSESLQ